MAGKLVKLILLVVKYSKGGRLRQKFSQKFLGMAQNPIIGGFEPKLNVLLFKNRKGGCFQIVKNLVKRSLHVKCWFEPWLKGPFWEFYP